MVINSFFLDYWHNVSHLIYASCYVRDTYCSRHLNFAIYLNREIREINACVAKISYNKVFSRSLSFEILQSRECYTFSEMRNLI